MNIDFLGKIIQIRNKSINFNIFLPFCFYHKNAIKLTKQTVIK